MIVIAVGQLKGGVGKTTLAVNVTGEIAQYGRSVTLIDADPQGSSAAWSEPQRLGFPVRHMVLDVGNDLMWARDILKMPTDFAVIDLPSGMGRVFDTAVTIADLLIVPCGPSSLDIGSAEKTIVAAKDVRRKDRTAKRLKIITAPTRVDASTPEGQHIAEALADLDEPVGPALSYDVGFVRSFTEGSTVGGVPNGETAAEEVKRLSAFVLRQVLSRTGREAA